MDEEDILRKNTFVRDAQKEAISQDPYSQQSSNRQLNIIPERVNSGEADSTFDAFISMLDTTLEASEKAFASYVTQKGSQDNDFKKSLQKTIEDMIKTKGKEIFEEVVPFGGVFVMTFQLSVAFAQGIGDALEKVNKTKHDKYKEMIDGIMNAQEGYDQEQKENLKALTQYQMINTGELPGILRSGLDNVYDFIKDALLEKTIDLIKDTVGELAKQIAKNLINTNEVIAIFSGAAQAAANDIPLRRRQVESLVLYHLSLAFVDQFADEKLKNSLAWALKKTDEKDDTIDVAILTGIIKTYMVIFLGAYREYIIGEDNIVKLKDALGLQAKKVSKDIQDKGKHELVESTGQLEIKPDHIGIPIGVYSQIFNGGIPTEADWQKMKHYRQRMDQFKYYIHGLKLSLESKAGRFQRILNEIPNPTVRSDKYTEYQEQVVTNYGKAMSGAKQAQGNIIREFGEQFQDAIFGGTTNVRSATDSEIATLKTEKLNLQWHE
jgi:hypothetical protein